MSFSTNARRALTPLVLVVATVVTVGLVAGSCGGDDGAATSGTTGAAAGRTDADRTASDHTASDHTASDHTASDHTASDHAASDHAAGDTAYGSHGMAPTVVTVDELAALGAGPAVGRTVAGSLGLNVCGRFLDPPAAATSATGVSTDGAGHFTITPSTDGTAGHAATIGDVLDLVGVDLSSRTVTFPAGQQPAQMVVGTGSVAVAGATFGPEVRCGDIDASVQLWVYSKDAVATGKDVRAVLVDPQHAPVVEDGMAFVVAVTPESSLPTLPPAAL